MAKQNNPASSDNIAGKENSATHKISLFEQDVRSKKQTPSIVAKGWDEFISIIKANDIWAGDKLAAGYFVRGHIPKGKQRDDSNLKSCCLAIVDIDVEPYPSRKKIAKAIRRTGVQAISYSTHTKGRSRIVFHCMAYEKAQVQAVQDKAYKILRKAGLRVAKVGEVGTASQPWFLPSDAGRGDGWIDTFDGKPLKTKNLKKGKIKKKSKGSHGKTFDGANPLGSTVDDFIADLEKGTIHRAALTYAGRLQRLTNLTIPQIIQECTRLIVKHCNNDIKVERWRNKESKKIAEWLEENTKEPEEEEHDFGELIPNGEQIEMSKKAKVLIEAVAKEGNVSIVCAPPNSGKTAIMFYHSAPKLAKLGYNVYYVDADSNASVHGLMYKFSRLKKFTWLNPYVAKKRMDRGVFLDTVFKNVDPHDSVIIIDTLKKFCDLMRKSDIKDFFVKAKSFAAKGGTVVVLSHTNKYPDSEGKWIFEGTNEIESEPDALTYLYRTPKGIAKNRTHTTVSLYSDKTRGSVGNVSYSLRNVKDYKMSNVDEMVQRLDEFVDLQELHKPIKENRAISAGDIIIAFEKFCLKGSIKRENGFVPVANVKKAIADSLNVSERRVGQALKRKCFIRSRGENGAWLIKLAKNVVV